MAFPFRHGRSYTEFALSDLAMEVERTRRPARRELVGLTGVRLEPGASARADVTGDHRLTEVTIA